MTNTLIKYHTHFFFLLSIALAFTFQVSGQVMYTDLVPDLDISSPENLRIDMDGDGNTDFELALEIIHEYDTYRYTYSIFPLEGSQVAVDDDSASVIQSMDTIGSFLKWSDAEEVILYDVMQYYGHSGHWYGVDRGFLGLRLKKAGSYLYGWLRIHAKPQYFRMKAVDVGLQLTPDMAVVAGQGIPQGATSVFAEDTDDHFDGRDFRISFTRAFQEDVFSGYRIIMAKAGDSSAFDLSEMNQVPPERYTSVQIDLLDDEMVVVVQLDSLTLDKDGDTLKMNEKYRAHLLNVAANNLPPDNVLSTPSDSLFMQSFAAPATNPVAWDADNTHSAADIRVTFQQAPKEWDLKEYRVFIAKPEDVLMLDPATAAELPPDRYSLYLPDGEDAEIELPANQRDVAGNEIQEDTFYQALVLSVADGFYSFTNAFSVPSREFMLREPNHIIAGQQSGNFLVVHPCDSLFSDETYWENETGIDLNRDGLVDFMLFEHEQISPMFFTLNYSIVPERENRVMICSHEEHDRWIDVLNYREAIGDVYRWTTETALLIDAETNAWTGANYWNGHMSSQRFHSGDPYYLGFLITDHETPQFAWLKMAGNVFIEYGFQDFNSTVKEKTSEKRFRIYPNPASDRFCMETIHTGETTGEMEVTLFNTMGESIYTQKLDAGINCIDLNSCPAGIYHCLIVSGNGHYESHVLIKK